jgi:hypothetical protein
MTKPTQVPQVKNGEQPSHCFFRGAFLLREICDAVFFRQSLSVQHGLAEASNTKNAMNKYNAFMALIYKEF